MKNRCDNCGEFAGFEESPEGQVCDVCDRWLCDNCISWANSGYLHDFICKECYIEEEDKILEYKNNKM